MFAEEWLILLADFSDSFVNALEIMALDIHFGENNIRLIVVYETPSRTVDQIVILIEIKNFRLYHL